MLAFSIPDKTRARVRTMLKRLVDNIKTSPFGEVFSRYKEIHGVLDKRGKLILLLLHVTHVFSWLLGTLKLAGLASFVLVLAKPEAVLSNRYAITAYDMFGFESKEFFLLTICGFLVGSIISQQIVGLLIKLVNIRLNSSLVRYLTTMMYNHYMTESYEDAVRRGSTTATTKTMIMVGRTVKAEVGKTKSFFSALVNGFILMGILLALSPIAASVLFVSATFYFSFFFMRYRKKAREIGQITYMKSLEKMQLLREGTTAAVELKMAGKGKDFVNRVRGIMIELLRNNMQKTLMNAIPGLILRTTGVLFLFLVAAIMLLKEGINYSFPVLLAFAVAAFRMLPIFRSFFSGLMQQESSRHRYQQVMQDLKPARKALDEETKLPEKSARIQFSNAIVFENVTYTYPETGEPVFENLSVSLPANQAIALFGSSGVGKTTFMRLTSGLLAPSNGQILIDGKSLHEDRRFKDKWQRSLGITFQKPFFMNASLAMNITFEAKKKNRDYDRIHEVVRIAQIEELVESLPDGVDTELTEDAELLSGGQRQRIAIARALYRNSPVLVFDEATNAIDLSTERKIVSALIKENTDKLVIIISHRRETLQFVDTIFFLQARQPIVQGTFDQIFTESTEFRNLFGPVAATAV